MTKKIEIEEIEEIEKEEENAETVKNDKTSVSVSVSFQGKVRVFSKEIHGKGFLKLAQEFANKFKGELA